MLMWICITALLGKNGHWIFIILKFIAKRQRHGVQLASNADSSAQLFNQLNSHLAFGTNNTEAMRIDSAGKLGIGSSAPAAKLDVAGNQIFTAANPQIQFNAGGPIIRLPSANTLAFKR